jgi:AcrR family transcriptional regulator
MSTAGVRGRPGRPAGPGGDARDALLRAAATQFSATGYAGASVRAILTDAATTAPALYHHFSNKAGLYVAVAEAAYDDVHQRFRAAVETASDPLGRVEAVLDAVCDLRRDHPHVARFFGVIEQDVGRHPELAGLCAARDRLTAFWATLLGKSQPGQALAVRSIVEGFLRLGDETLTPAQIKATGRALRSAVRNGLGAACQDSQQ